MSVNALRSSVMIVGVASLAMGLFACGAPPPAASPEQPPAAAPSANPVGKKPYTLNRTVYQIELSQVPLSRTRCWLSVDGVRKEKSNLRYTDTHTFEWDPSSTSPPIRYASLGNKNSGAPKLRCSAEPVRLGVDGDAKNFAYVFEEPVAAEPGKNPPVALPTLVGKLVSVAKPTDGAGTNPQTGRPRNTVPSLSNDLPSVTVKVTKVENGDPEIGGVDGTLSRNRSLDPLTPIATELLTVIAEIAVERAKASATEAIKDTLKSSVCLIKYDHDDSAEIHFPEDDDKALEKLEKDVAAARKKLEDAKSDDKKAEALKAAEGFIVQVQDINNRKCAADESSDACKSLQAAKVQLAKVVKEQGGKVVENGSAKRMLVFSRVCTALDGLRIEEIASSSNVLVRALSGDLTEYAFRYMRAKFGNGYRDAQDFVKALEPVVLGLVEGKTIVTERDFQSMLLRVGAIRIPEDDGKQWWQCGVGIGFAVARECLRRDACTAEQLLSALERELEEPSAECKASARAIDQEWPELRSILSRSIDVFRPPPGTSPNQTGKVATNILLDVLKQAPRIRDDAAVRREFESIRALINAVFDKDLAAGAVAVSGAITAAIEIKYNGSKGKSRDQSATPQQVKKGVALLNAFVSYASTYKEGARDGEEGKTAAEREKIRHEERKKAMESLIEAATNRANRGGDWIFSAGVAAGLTSGRIPLHGGTPSAIPVPSLALGLAVDLLPKYTPAGFPDGRLAGFHAQMTLLDLAQYATLDGKGNTVALKAENALFIGGNIGLLLGTPKYSVLLAAEIGYAPSLKFDGASSPGVLRAGGMVGTYIPFFDFN